MSRIVAGRHVFFVQGSDELILLLGNLPDMSRREYAALVGASDPKFLVFRHPRIGALDHRLELFSGWRLLLCIEVHPRWRRHGVGSLLVDELCERYGEDDLLADCERVNTTKGNRFIARYNRRRGREVIVRAGDDPDDDDPPSFGYPPSGDDSWKELAPRHLPAPACREVDVLRPARSRLRSAPPPAART